MTLGDGTLNRKNGYFAVRHCAAQLDYLQWKHDLIRGSIKTSGIYRVSNNGYGAYELRTKSYKFMKTYRRFLYPDGCKVIHNRKLLDKLTPLGLAIWYMDDGGLSQKKNPKGYIDSNDLTLNTYLSKEANQIIIDYFKEVWDISFTQNRSKGKYRLRCGTKEARKFISIVFPYVSQVKSMAHKLNVKECK